MWGESPDWFQRRCCWTPATSDWTYYWWHDPSCYHTWSCQGDEMSCSLHHSPVNQNTGAWPQNMNTYMSNEDLWGFVEVYVGLCLPINVLEYHRACVQCTADLIWKKRMVQNVFKKSWNKNCILLHNGSPKCQRETSKALSQHGPCKEPQR